jgi:glycosyltransferase involved in cell wall biosynthesis
MVHGNKKSIWFISKYLRLPGGTLDFTDVMQNNGAHPGRGFSLLRSLSKQGYDCTLFVARHDYRPLKSERTPSKEVHLIDGVRVIFLNVLPFRRTTSIARILGWVQFELRLFFIKTHDLPRPDYIVASSLSLLSVLNGLIFRWRTKAKLVFEVRDVWPMVLTENGSYSRFNPFVLGLRVIEWLGYKYSDDIVATMPNLGEHVENVLGFPRKVYCIPMGIPDELLNEPEVRLPVKLVNSFPRDKFIVTYVGSIGVDNALDSLFEAARILQHDTKIVFRVFGKGDLLDKYRKDCGDLDNVYFGGAIPNNMVQPVLKNSSVLYLATHPTAVLRYGQSLNKLIDYMYSGRAILASHSGFQSMINEAKCGYFVPAGDAQSLCKEIIDLSKISNSELKKVGARGRIWLLENRLYDKLAIKYISVLNG